MVIDHLNPRFGPVVQLGYVCDDAVEVSRYWAKHFGAGPFHLIEEICFDNWTYHGEPQDLPLKITIGNYGSVQLEFIQPGQRVLMTMGDKMRIEGGTNTMRLVQISETGEFETQMAL